MLATIQMKDEMGKVIYRKTVSTSFDGGKLNLNAFALVHQHPEAVTMNISLLLDYRDLTVNERAFNLAAKDMGQIVHRLGDCNLYFAKTTIHKDYWNRFEQHYNGHGGDSTFIEFRSIDGRDCVLLK
jgi:hypothetical protein